MTPQTPLPVRSVPIAPGITLGGDAPKRERLFRAAVSAFCSLTRPSRRDISQLEDLTLPLFDGVSPESRRYVAAALSECRYPPPNLVKRLCDEPLDAVELTQHGGETGMLGRSVVGAGVTGNIQAEEQCQDQTGRIMLVSC